MRVEFPVTHPFDYQLAMDRLAGYRAPRNKLRSLCLSGDLVRVRKGLYVAAASSTPCRAVPKPSTFLCCDLTGYSSWSRTWKRSARSWRHSGSAF